MKIVNPVGFYMRVQLMHCLAFLLFALVPYNSFAVDACVEDGTRAVVLDPINTGAGGWPGYFDNATQTWRVELSNGTKILGIAACLSHSNTDSNGIYKENNGILMDNDVLVKGGEANGRFCWCKMIYPAVSLWVHGGSWGYSTVSDCTQYGTSNYGCAQRCSGLFAGGSNYSILSTQLFKAIKE